MEGDGLEGWVARLTVASAAIGTPVVVDGWSLLGERRALDGPRPSATRVLRCADGWVAVSLARDWDREAVPAWLGAAGTWDAVEPAVAARTGAELVAGAELLGLAVGVLGERAGAAVTATRFAGPRRRDRGDRRLRVLDLSALWAGPLCASLLAEAGADVVKVESTARPDASRQGTPNLFARLNRAKRSVQLDLASAAGRADLAALVGAADVVVESSRPRALEQMGVVAADMLAGPGLGPQVWVSITGHGRASNRVGFGDDAAVAGGLIRWDDGVPTLWGDAAADPSTGLVAATVAFEALAGEQADTGPVLLDVALAGVAAELAPLLPPAPPDSPAEPVSTEPTPPVPPLGADTAAVLAEWVGR